MWCPNRTERFFYGSSRLICFSITIAYWYLCYHTCRVLLQSYKQQLFCSTGMMHSTCACVCNVMIVHVHATVTPLFMYIMHCTGADYCSCSTCTMYNVQCTVHSSALCIALQYIILLLQKLCQQLHWTLVVMSANYSR